MRPLKKYLNGYVVLITFLVGFFFGQGLNELSHTHTNLYGFTLILCGLGTVYAQVRLVVRRELRKAASNPPTLSPETCVLELSIHRGMFVDAEGKTVDPAQIPPGLRRADPFALRATVSTEPGVDLGKLATMVRSFANDLDKTHHERVSQAN